MSEKKKIAYLSDIEGAAVVPSGAVRGNFAVFGADSKLSDPGVSPSDFYPKTTIDDKIANALAAAEQFVSDQHALASYKAGAWAANTEYAENDYCQYGGKGYRCVVAHTSGAGFAPTKWQLVLSAAGKAAIDAALAPYSSDDKARLLDLCNAYNSKSTYVKGQMVLQDGILKICTVAGRGAAAVFSAGTVDEAIEQRLAVHAENTKQKQSDWNTTDEDDPSYIKHKPNIPSAVTIDDTLSQEGAAADAKAVGDALGGINPRYAFMALSPLEPSESENVITYQLVDGAINYIAIDNIAYGYSITLLSPPAPSAVGSVKMERDFVVVFNVDTESDLFDTVEVVAPGNSFCYNGNPADVSAHIGRLTAYRFTEISDSGSTTYLVTGASDPAYAGMEIERALDTILADGGSSEFTPGMYIFNEGNGYYYKLSAVTDSETGETNIAVDQEGVLK